MNKSNGFKLNQNVIAIDALGIVHHGKLIGHSTVNRDNALLQIAKNKIMEISFNKLTGA